MHTGLCGACASYDHIHGIHPAACAAGTRHACNRIRIAQWPCRSSLVARTAGMCLAGVASTMPDSSGDTCTLHASDARRRTACIRPSLVVCRSWDSGHFHVQLGAGLDKVVLQASWAGRGSTEHLVDDRGEFTLLFPVVGFPVALSHFFFFLVGFAGRVIRAIRSYITGSDSYNASLNDG